MKRTIALATALMLSHLAPSFAETTNVPATVAQTKEKETNGPTQEQLEARAKELEKKLEGQGYTILVEPPFVVIGDSPAKEVKRVTTGFLRRKVSLLEQEFFTKRPDRVLDVWLFKNRQSFFKGAKKFFNDDPGTPYGYYSPDDNALIMNAWDSARCRTSSCIRTWKRTSPTSRRGSMKASRRSTNSPARRRAASSASRTGGCRISRRRSRQTRCRS
jgi:hypothetical protein